jgi:choloylglycine hydrolase
MCTGIRFADDNGALFAGRNLDWECGYGEGITITPRNYERKYAFEPAATGHAIIGTCIIVNDMPLYFDCGNEKGLYIAGLNFPGYAQFEKDQVAGKTNIAAYEFPLWVASEFATVDEAEAALQNVAIVGKQVNDQYPVSLLHYFICDAKRAIVVEYMADGMHIYHDDVDVLTNQPTFPWQMEHLRSYLNLSPEFVPSVKWDKAELTPYGSGGHAVGMPGSTYSPDRFVRVAYYNTHYPDQVGEQANTIRLFRTLWSVQQILGGALMEDGKSEYTVYTGGFSAASNTYYLSHYEDPDIKSYALSATSLEGTALYTFA